MAQLPYIWAALAACFQENPGPLSSGQVLAWIAMRYAASNFNSNYVRHQLYRSAVNVPSAQNYKTPKIVFFDRSTKTYSLVGPSTPVQVSSEDAYADSDLEAQELSSAPGREDQSDLRVDVEARLRDYLAKNLGKLESGLQFWISSLPSVEITIENRRLDILARDAEGVPVVIELKRHRAYDHVVGQGLLYQALVARAFKQTKVRVILVADEISAELRLAC